MFAIAFDMNIGDLRSNYGEPYNNAYYEYRKPIKLAKAQEGFVTTQQNQ